MEIGEDRRGAVLVLSPQGRLDSTTAPAFEQTVRARLAEGHRDLVIDLAALDYVSSAGLRIFMVIAKSLKAERGRIVLCRLQDGVREILRISAFDRIFTILPSVTEGVALLAAED
jgi:anti-anti-sigma factor